MIYTNFVSDFLQLAPIFSETIFKIKLFFSAITTKTLSIQML